MGFGKHVQWGGEYPSPLDRVKHERAQGDNPYEIFTPRDLKLPAS